MPKIYYEADCDINVLKGKKLRLSVTAARDMRMR